jgi:hypothetical protein
MGSRRSLPRPNPDWCSQYFEGMEHTYEFSCSGDDAEWRDTVIVMTDELHLQLFNGDMGELNTMVGYSRNEKPWIYVPKWSLLIHREGRMYKHQSGAERDSRTFVLRLLRLHNGYPILSVTWDNEKRTRASRTAHGLMAWATRGVRPDRHVTDHVGQSLKGRENFAESNLEYVTYAENSRRHWNYVRSMCGLDDEQDVADMVAELGWLDLEDEDEDEVQLSDLNDLSFVDEDEDEDEDEVQLSDLNDLSFVDEDVAAAPDAVPTPDVTEGNQVSKRPKLD